TKQKLKDIAIQCITPSSPNLHLDDPLISENIIEIPVEQPKDIPVVKPGFSKKTSSFYLRTLQRIKEKGLTFMLHEDIRNNEIEQFLIAVQQAKQNNYIDVNTQYV